ncbi:MAG: putative nicotinate-nucleotide adenylyltransferase [Thermoanaerobacterales bacterium 50_218]|nr:MAG: putative nicotinate-nucleotide adenylyltransferase [Thermoanaerobacterales bacterium 50_218]HAA90765.1 nicotinic acid mononucleotide adenylyltransferase [Peptococcaceae bacterium]
MSKHRIGIMGGTFDPIHYGHLVTAEVARETYRLDQVIFVPSGQPPHKAPGSVSDFWHRYLMVMLAICSNPWFRVSRIEYDRGGPSYTIDTIREFKRIFGEGTELYFITGADAILEIFTWKQPEELLSSCRFIAATRPGYDLGKLENLLGEYFSRSVSVLEVPLLSISSSELRMRVRRGLSIKYLVPDPVEIYIHHNGLYKEVET